MNNADRIFGALVALSGNIATTNANTDSHIESAAIGHRCNNVLGVDKRKLG